MDFYYRPQIAAMVTDWVLYMTPVKGVREIVLDKAAELEGADREYYQTLANSPLLFPPEDPTRANLYEYKRFTGEEFTAWNELFEKVIRG
jgi:spermidine/putrescine transport system substrate-binding protein